MTKEGHKQGEMQMSRIYAMNIVANLPVGKGAALEVLDEARQLLEWSHRTSWEKERFDQRS